MRFACARSLDAFEEHASAWRRLHRACGASPFSGVEWISEYWANIASADDRPCVLVAYDDAGTAIAGLPLSVRVQRISRLVPFRCRVVTLLPGPRAGFGDVPMLPGCHEAVAGLLDLAQRELGGALMDLQPLRQGPALRALVTDTGRSGRAVFCRQEMTAGSIDLRDGPQKALARRSARTRKAMRQRLKRVEGRTRVARSDSGDPSRGDLLEAAFSVARASWKAQAGTDIASCENDRAFFRGLLARANSDLSLHVTVTRLDNIPVASTLTLCSGRQAYSVIGDHRADHAHLGPGHIALWHEMQTAYAHGCRELNLLRMSPFIARYSDRAEPLMRVRMCRRHGWVWGVLHLERIAKGLKDRLSRAQGRGLRPRGQKPRKVVAP